MFGLGVWELVVIAIVALLVLGPERLPKLARQVAMGMREFRRAATELQHTMEEAAREVDLEQVTKTILKSPDGVVPQTDAKPPAPPAEPPADPKVPA